MANDLSAQLRNLGMLADAPSADTDPSGDVYGVLCALISRIAGVEDVERDMRLDDLHITSLDRVEFAVRAEEALKVRVEEADALGWESVQDVVAYFETRAENP